jgi:MFS family permease
MTITSKSERLYSLQFWLLCVSNFFFSASFQMLLPELPDYLTSLGGAEYKGYILFLFTLTAGASRPFSGKLTDNIGRVPIMIFGSLVCVVCSALYPLMTTVFGFLMLRLIHGFSTGFKPTATAAYVADVISFERRGEAMSMLGISSSVGMSIAPVIGSAITTAFGINALFGVSSVFAFLSVFILVKNMKETLPNPQPFSPNLLKINRSEVYEPKAIPTFIVQILVSFASGVVLTLIPDLSKHLGIANKGMFFTVYTFSSLLIRLVAGKSSDKYGRLNVLMWSSLAMVLSMILIAQAQTPLVFWIAAIVYGISWGMNTPTLQAWAVDLSPPEARGRGLATMFIALEAGIGIGAWVSQKIYGNNISQISSPFYLSGLLAFVSFLYLWYKKRESILSAP